MYYYSLTRTLDTGPGDGYSTTVSIGDRDAINCGHMIATGFNTMSRNFTLGWVLGLVHPETGEVQYDGKIEQIKRDEPRSVSQTFNFEASTDADTIVTIFDNENGRLMYPGKFKFAETDETTSAVAAETVASTISRKVLESAYVELHRVKDVLFDAGVETIPADAGVTDLRAVLRARDAEISELVQALATRAVEVEELRQTLVELAPARNAANEAARAEMIEYVKGAYAKLGRLDPAGERDDLQGRMRGMLDVLAKFLVVTGEADHDERHAVARRLCGIPEGARV